MFEMSHCVGMVRPHLIMTCAMLSLTACATEHKSSQKFEMTFDGLQYDVDNINSLADIVDNTKVAIKVIDECGAHFLGVSGNVTDGAETFYIEVNGNPQMITTCIRRRMPKADLRPSRARYGPGGPISNDSAVENAR